MLDTFILAAVTAVSLPIPLTDAATPILTVQAGGVQIYRCTSTAQQPPAWALDRPAATLYREDGSTFGTHGAGPTWTANDGSAIVADGAAPLARLAQPTAVPWLALRVKAHTGSGILADARYVERYDTAGGVAPAQRSARATAWDKRGRSITVPSTNSSGSDTAALPPAQHGSGATLTGVRRRVLARGYSRDRSLSLLRRDAAMLALDAS